MGIVLRIRTVTVLGFWFILNRNINMKRRHVTANNHAHSFRFFFI